MTSGLKQWIGILLAVNNPLAAQKWDQLLLVASDQPLVHKSFVASPMFRPTTQNDLSGHEELRNIWTQNPTPVMPRTILKPAESSSLPRPFEVSFCSSFFPPTRSSRQCLKSLQSAWNSTNCPVLVQRQMLKAGLGLRLAQKLQLNVWILIWPHMQQSVKV